MLRLFIFLAVLITSSLVGQGVWGQDDKAQDDMSLWPKADNGIALMPHSEWVDLTENVPTSGKGVYFKLSSFLNKYCSGLKKGE